MIKFTCKEHPNFHVKFDDDKLHITVTLNVSPDMTKFLKKEQLVKMPKYWVYFQKAVVELSKMNESRILSIANKLLDKCMIDCRVAKQQVLQFEIMNIPTHVPRIQSEQ